MDRERENGRRWTAWVNGLLMIVNVLVFVVGTAGTGRIWAAGFMIRAGALYAPLLLKGQGFYRLLTSMFIHADTVHLFNNMIVLFAGGVIAEKNLGHIRYGLLYILSGIGGNLASAALDLFTGQYGYSVGSSGAVFGVIGALVYMILREYLDHRGEKDKHNGSRNVYQNLLVRAGFMTVYLLYSGWKNPTINQAAHAGGIIVGFVLAAVFMSDRRGDLHDLMK